MSLKQEIFEFVEKDLADIERALEANLNPYLDLVRDVASHLLFAGGKRLRPVLMVLSARVCGCNNGEEINLSTVFEYLHAATLLHDDIVDGAETRRGKIAAHKVWDPAEVVLTGDFLLSRTCTIAADTDKLPIIKVITNVTGVMSEGEIQQLLNKKRLDLSEEQYMDVIYRKTAVLISAACEVGALLADAPPEQVEALKEYGRHLGIAFQMADDLLDYVADPKVTGKAIGADLAEGKLTLPLIHALEQTGSETRPRMEKIILDENASKEDFAFVLDNIIKSGGVDYTNQKAQEHVAAAKALLDIFPDCPEKDVLAKVADFAAQRDS
ncbi:Polyprenyl synthetase [Desulfatibacillum aliphaticivorans]|uniref:Polyprenyl synthetase n=1 Tax=Desulfatibacillum aliphaticivorans TaxID=218208 RepID=B8FGL7_DESAL|nr:polyprenyl synthetase family protein [Desulfatibacillum aliphaticivorans]ACL04926.1 Polyprenyl synthetase [Desulfatibacillum aliphaticivorans]